MKTKVNAAVVKNALRSFLLHSCPDKYIEELGVPSVGGRIDVATINSQLLHGYEVKSDVDDLNKLAVEVERYGKIVDRMTLVATEKHMPEARKMVPRWWGLIVYNKQGDVLVLREPKPNPNPCFESRVRALWKPEALRLLRQMQAEKGLLSKPARSMHDRIFTVCTMEQVHGALLQQYQRHGVMMQ